jgi:DNA anti-recombination protein RmuC
MRQSFADQLKQIDDYQERLEQMSEKARADYNKAMEQMEAKADEARRTADRTRDANEAAWKDMFSASQKAFAELQKGWAGAVDRFQ